MSATTAASIHDTPTLTVGDLTLTVAPPGERTTIEIVVERDASLVLKAPPGVSAERATRFVTAKRHWIYRKLAEKDALIGPPIVKRFVEGEGFAYLGRSYRLTLTDGAGDQRSEDNRPGPGHSVQPTPASEERSAGNRSGPDHRVRQAPASGEHSEGDRTGPGHRVRQEPTGRAEQPELPSVRLERGRFHLPAGEAHRGAAAMRRWYTDTGGHWLRRRIRPWAARLGEHTAIVEVRDLGYRWGSARPTTGPQRINIHWAALQLPPSLIDYILVHELAHLHHTNHTPQFWTTVGRLIPTYEDHKTNLAAVGKNVWLGAVG